MSVRNARTAAASAVIAAAVAAVLAGTASAETVTVNARGTGQEMPKEKVVHTDDGVIVENDYPAQIAPIPGHTRTYNQSLEEGDQKGPEIVEEFAKPGDTVVCKGYSLGGEVAGDTCDELYIKGKGDEFNLVTHTDSDPRLRGSGIAVMFKQFTDELPEQAYPLVHFRGERASQGKVQYYGNCAEYDLICNSGNPFVNPFGTAAAFLGYAFDDQHNYTNMDKFPTRVVTYDGGYTVITVVDKGNPLVKFGDQAAKVLTGKPLTESEKDLVEAVSPAGTPGSQEQVAPDPVAVSEAAGEVASEAYVEYAPQVVNTAVDAGVTQVTGNAVVGDAAGDVAEWAVTPLIKATAPVIGDGIEATTKSVMTGDPSAVNGFVNGLVPGANLPVR